MSVQKTKLAPVRMLLLSVGAGIAAILLALSWPGSAEEAAPPVTEHEFGHGRLVWTIDAYPAKALRDNAFTVTVTGPDGKPLHGAKLAVNLDMLGMICGDVDFAMTEVAPGTYAGSGVPLMAGTWKATATLESGGQTYTVSRLLKAVR
ncbi:FixH family protein [Paenibacillus arenilitoris]|uniref:FixH family protein n=1 Tax=Paenibacillus arenilitoris TaxID=2772299 RepID=A0A927CTB5_9BACL|nr:FixH family protein [Paenibacillus arenilitoris]MBD2871195.1 FixH family protein [Paenibacillus arenilitoris]